MTITLNARRVAAVLALALALSAAVAALRLGGSAQALTAAAAASSGTPISGVCTGEAQGIIKGSNTRKGQAGTYTITGLSHAIGVPTEAGTGQATGRRIHQPLAFTMVVDRSTAPLLRAEFTNENLTTCAFSFWRRSPDGAKEFKYLRVDLRDAHVVNYALSGRPGGQDVVTFKLAYRAIDVTYTDGGLTASDDWYYND